MPVNFALKSLARDGRFSLDDAQKLQQLVQRGEVSEAEAQEALKRYGDVMDPEAGSLLESFTGGARAASVQGLGAELSRKTLRHGASGDDVRTLQRGLMALGMREQNPAFTMPTGVDGQFGNETRNAVRAFQRAHGIPPTGVADPATLRALDEELRGEVRPGSFTPAAAPLPSGQMPRPTLGLQRPADEATTPASAPATDAPAAGPPPATNEATAAAAQSLVDGPTGASYGTSEAWVNNDPRHAAPTGRPLNGTKDKWKCNLFAGNVMAAAGFEPPYYGNRRTGGEYPNANQLYKWSDRYAARYGNANHVRFEMRDEVKNLPRLSDDEKETRIQQMLDRLEPGDLLIADHVGSDVADGGHCRVFLGKDEDGDYRFAQAGDNAAEVASESAGDLMDEEHLWILRPNTPRKG